MVMAVSRSQLAATVTGPLSRPSPSGTFTSPRIARRGPSVVELSSGPGASCPLRAGQTLAPPRPDAGPQRGQTLATTTSNQPRRFDSEVNAGLAAGPFRA